MTKKTSAETPEQVPAKLSKLAVALQTVNANAAEIQALAPTIADLEKKYAGVALTELGTKKGDEAAALILREVRAPRFKIQNLEEDGKKLLNGLKSELSAAAQADVKRLFAVETPIVQQVDAHKAKEKDRIARHEQNVQAISLMAEGVGSMNSEQIGQRMAALDAIIIDDSYEEYMAQAIRKRKDVSEVLREAFNLAERRQSEAEAARQEQEKQARELAEFRAKEAKTAAIKAKIDAMKAIPDQVLGTDMANMREALRIHDANVPTAEVFGDLLELAELQHFKVSKLLQGLIDEEVAAAVEEAAPNLNEVAVADLESGALPGVPVEDSQWTPAQLDEIAESGAEPLVFNKVSPQEPDPFTAPPATPAPRPVARAPIPAPVEAVAVTESDVPDLLEAAKRVLASWDDFQRRLPEAIQDLRAAVDFINEFAD